MLLLGGNPGTSIVSREDLSDGQLDTLTALDLARTPTDVREGKLALNQVMQLDSGRLVMAGSWEGELKLGGESHEARGGRDVFVAELSVDGSWESLHVAGSSGEDSVVMLTSSGEQYIVLGRINGQAHFSHTILEHYNGWSPTAFEAHLSLDEGWTGSWEIDEEFLPESSSGLWCGYA